ncbi:transmembrane anchored protein [Dolichospermum sp. ST_con]|nr:transmembrane anchored protein [Dolichospermum sp. ST_con]MDD1421879.1 transmembrane anchored protein [Dolichospermum sp. ST_sed1]MDD1424408.1 transmembrane anchored protein [Dolichospermum sp. ST_sed9]MDD1433950.1 transmembrane anchored protein [Dolichospermum sp. ST_sed6]MDD1441061.1 transmembrane anchored protein [Dolichospermum sp. ST_sed3]MDD1448942.1 transmembrane anchored protein [Dolichospermum sp. ST_sed8]MDD1457539.1 transmembrane anchored protein [Dolichospermum sp. ST_sed7]MDD
MSTFVLTGKLFALLLTGLIITSCSEGTSSSTGNCQNPDDRAADGSRCGNRAASVRPGGN